MSQPLDYATPIRRSPLARLAPTLAIYLLLIAILYFAIRGPFSPSGRRLWDYAVCASSAQVWLRGDDPYDARLVNDNWRSVSVPRGFENHVDWLRPIVPPTTLAVLAPFAALPVGLGLWAYLATTLATLACAVWQCGRWAGLEDGMSWRFFVAAILMSVPATLGLYSGNPVVLAGPLVLLGLCRAATRSDDWRAALLLGIGAACKVQVGLPLMAIAAFTGRWRLAARSALVVAAFAAIGCGRMAITQVDWLQSWSRSVVQANGKGGANDFGTTANPDDHLNLQVPLWWLSGDRSLANAGAIALTLCSMAAFGAVWLHRPRRPTFDDDRRALPIEVFVAAIGATLLVLPVYHRTYDGVVLLPALAIAIRAVRSGDGRSRDCGWIASALLATLLVPAGLPGLLQRRGYVPDRVALTLFYNAFIVPSRAWAMLMLSAVLLTLFFWRLHGNPINLGNEKDPRGKITA